ncbi:hypothetical protein [Thermoactinospora rubra]|uniref:hypothetical protein n=1 Tax=Thermoactinospora rubra TaxID=1088767 RepID=UPI000A0FDFC8|nr:hypothetical protein [Thermoactinospora rubra]
MRLRSRLLTVATAAALVLGSGLLHAAPAAAIPANHICDPVDPAACLLPFPNDWFTRADAGSPTGRRVDLSILATPRSVGLIPIDPAEWNKNDGFSPGQAVLARVPGIDLRATGAAPITDMARSLAPDAPIVIVDAATGERHPYWAELDANAPDSRRALIVRPARNFAEGHRYLVLLRNLRTASGAVIPPGAKTADLLDGEPWYSPDRERSDRLRRTVSELQRLGVSTEGVYLAWDFTVASTRGLTSRMLHIRDDAFAKLGAAAPAFTVTQVTDYTPEQDARIARKVRGTVTLPSYLDQPGGPPGSSFSYGSNGLPAQAGGNTQTAGFVCNLPRGTAPARPALFGHGLLGTADQIDAGDLKQASFEHNIMLCATDWIGMSSADVPNVVTVFGDFSRFKTIPDRTQQGFLNFLFLGRALKHPDGLASHAAFRGRFDPNGLVYAGASQGGILGAALTGVAQDFTRSALIVPAINYSTLLNRSVDFDQFQPLLDATYPDKLDQQLVFGLIQMLWDRGEGNGYAAHLASDPLPGTPAKRVLIHEAFGDHQVANVATEVLARTMGARVRQPALEPGRSPDVTPFWGIPAVPSSPHAGSALVMWDSGSPPPPLTNTPPREGHDPHGDTGGSPEARAQLAHFFATGEVIDTCGGAPCKAPSGR